ncbi:MAG: hypothetical protein L0241_28975 [Planctomycetia bacterium]|nr:hypothetical protein [Planctomycetia bacterium]
MGVYVNRGSSRSSRSAGAVPIRNFWAVFLAIVVGVVTFVAALVGVLLFWSDTTAWEVMGVGILIALVLSPVVASGTYSLLKKD